MDAVAALLRSRGAGSIDHPGGTLFAHLERVQLRLVGLGLGADLRLAGLSHALYGTDGFDVALLELAERPLLSSLIGERAERLVYRYAACDRARTWRDLPRRRLVRNRFTGDDEELGSDELRDFADLSLVNELDVAEHATGFLDAHGDWLRRLATCWEPLLSPAVSADARRVLG
ncbi:MAG: hypothetical protein JWQ99_147 [Blastococcus sp.]|jgi:hypothetical protein|nr:hypothetical protein [Blastococcus sp.]